MHAEEAEVRSAGQTLFETILPQKPAGSAPDPRATFRGPTGDAGDERELTAGAASAGESELTREQLVERIVVLNPTATEGFLAAFPARALRSYFDHLTIAAARGRASRWIRPAESPAIVWRDAEE